MRSSDAVIMAEARAAAKDGSASRARKAARLTQREVAEVCHVSPATVSMWETGHRVPRGKAALAYGRLLRALSERPGAALAGLRRRIALLGGGNEWQQAA